MKIIVSVKQVPDTSGKVAVNPDGTLDRASMQTITNPDDLNAVEAALKLKDATGCKVVVITMGPPPPEGMLPVEDVLPHPVKTDVTIAVVSNNAHNFFALITNSSSFFFHAAGLFLLYLCDKFIIKAGKFWVNIRYFRNIQDFRVICCFMNS